MSPELAVILILCFIILLFAMSLRRSEYENASFKIRIRRMDMDSQQSDMYMQNTQQRVLIVESRVDYLMRIQEAKERGAEKEPKAKRLKRKIDSER